MKRLIPAILLCLLLLCSCAIKRQATPRRYSTLSQKALTTLRFDQQEYSMNCAVQIWHNELIVLSLQPMLGIELFRMEASKDSVLLIDKMNRRYTTLSYDWADKDIRPAPSYKMIQDFLTTPDTKQEKATSEQTFRVGSHTIGLKCKFSQREYNTLTAPKQMNLKKYKRVSLRDILPL